jgi:hypothetical protein
MDAAAVSGSMQYPAAEVKEAGYAIEEIDIWNENGGMHAKIHSPREPDGGEVDYFDYYGDRSGPARARAPRRPKPRWTPKIVDDWPDEVPVFVEELELYELYFGNKLDDILGINK